MEKDNNQVLTVRFIGPRLKKNGLPIYELGTAFVATQRIVNKAYLAHEERLEKGKYPEKDERERLSLQIGLHEKRSDFFAFIPILTDPVALEAIKKSIEFVISGLTSYAVRKVLDNVRGENDARKQIFIGSIHADLVNIVNRIDNVGGCESIEIGSPKYAPQKTIEFTRESRDYIRHVADEPFLGQIQTIKGSVFKLYPNIEMVEVRRPGGKKCKVFLSPADFDSIRYGQIRSPVIKATGRPRYRIGMQGRAFEEFEAHSVTLLEDEEG